MTPVLKKDAYKLLKNEIEKRGIKTKFVAGKIGINSNYFGQVLSGSRNLSTDVAIKASQVLDIPLSIFLNKSQPIRLTISKNERLMTKETIMLAIIGFIFVVILAILGNLYMANIVYFLYTCFICAWLYYALFLVHFQALTHLSRIQAFADLGERIQQVESGFY